MNIYMWKSLTHEERVNQASKYLKEHFSQSKFTNFADPKHVSFGKILRKYHLNYEALEKANVFMITPPFKIWTKDQQFNYCVRYVKEFSKNYEFDYRKYPGINKFMLDTDIRDKVLDITKVYLKGKNYRSMTKKQRFEWCVTEVKKYSIDGMFSVTNKTANINNHMQKDGIREDVLKKVQVQLASTIAHQYSNMTEEQLIGYCVEHIKLTSIDGVWNSNNKENISIYNLMNRYAIVDIVLNKAKVLTAKQKRNPIHCMTDQERLNYAITYIMEHSEDGVFLASKHTKFYDIFKRRYKEVYTMALKEAGVLRSNNEVLLELSKKLQKYQKNGIDKYTTLNELIAYELPKSIKSLSNIASNNYLLKNLVKLLYNTFPTKNIDLKQLTRDSLLLLLRPALKQYTIRTQTQISNKFIEIFLLKAIEKNIVVPAALETKDSYIDAYVKTELSKLKQPNDMYEHCILLFSHKLPYKHASLMFIKNLSGILPKEFKKEIIFEFDYSKYGIIDNKYFGKVIRNSFIKPLEEKGILPKSMLHRWYGTHQENKNTILKKERTVLWYALEEYSNILSADRKQRALFVMRFKDVAEVKAIDFSVEHMKTLKHGNGLIWHHVVMKMIADGLCSNKVIIDTKETENYFLGFDWNSDVWYYSKDGAQYNFTLFDETFRKAAKTYIWQYSNELTKTIKGWSDLVQVFKIFTYLGINNLSELNIDTKRMFYLSLRSMENESSEQHRIAFRLLKKFRSFINTLIKLEYDEISPSLDTKNDNFTISTLYGDVEIYTEDEMIKIITFLKSDEKATGQFMNRLELCAFGLTVLFARRVGETVKASSVKDSIGFTIDALEKWGFSEELILKYYSPKHKCWETVLLQDMVGNREDPSSKEIFSLGSKLFEEAIEITSKYRVAFPNLLKKTLFVTEKHGGGFTELKDSVLRKRVYTFFDSVGIDRKKKGLHKFRHLMASHLIMSGGNVADAADALNDSIQTITRYYHKFADRTDTLRLFARLGRTQMIQAETDSAHFMDLEQNSHKVLMPEHMNPNGQKMACGSCTASILHMLNCSSYQMINASDGCPGCRHLEINAIENKGFWLAQMKAKLQEVDTAIPGSTGYRFANMSYKKAKRMVEELEQKELEYELS